MNKKTFKKRAFISAIAMLVVSAIVLTSATFAWFAMSTKVTIEEMQLSITAPDGVQISANPFAFTTSLLYSQLTADYNKTSNRFGAYVDNMNHFPSFLEPVSTAFNGYNSTYHGRNTYNPAFPGFYKGEMNREGTTITTASLSEEDESTYYGEKKDSTPYVVFDIFIKVAENKTIDFSRTTLECESNSDVPCAMRMGFVNCGVLAPVKDTDEGVADKILAVKPALVSDRDSQKVLVFDADHHTADAKTNHKLKDNEVVKTDAIVQGTVDNPYEYGVTGKNKAVKGALDTASPICEICKKTDGSLTVFSNGATVSGMDSPASIQAKPGINRIRCYIWMEGQDEDCAIDVAGQDLNVKIVFALPDAL